MVDKCEKAMKQFSAMKTVQFIGMSYKQLAIKYFRSNWLRNVCTYRNMVQGGMRYEVL